VEVPDQDSSSEEDSTKNAAKRKALMKSVLGVSSSEEAPAQNKRTKAEAVAAAAEDESSSHETPAEHEAEAVAAAAEDESSSHDTPAKHEAEVQISDATLDPGLGPSDKFKEAVRQAQQVEAWMRRARRRFHGCRKQLQGYTSRGSVPNSSQGTDPNVKRDPRNQAIQGFLIDYHQIWRIYQQGGLNETMFDFLRSKYMAAIGPLAPAVPVAEEEATAEQEKQATAKQEGKAEVDEEADDEGGERRRKKRSTRRSRTNAQRV